jgi:hypothetical protein
VTEQAVNAIEQAFLNGTYVSIADRHGRHAGKIIRVGVAGTKRERCV